MASVPPISLEPGYRLDRYELLCKIGQGGMASVWLARTQGKHGFERLVALKTVLPEHASDREFRTMLLDEARIAAGIDHPNVARILDVGEDRDVPFIVLEYIAGDSLARLHRTLSDAGKRVPPEIAIRVLADTCTGLNVAHELKDASGKELGIVHRDVSPQNILVNDLGIVKVIDFGVAKAAGRLAAETATGIMKGKVPYMAPEQALGVPVDRRADIWAVGAVAYVLLAGKYPFDAANDAGRIIRAVTGDGPDPLPPSAPPGLAAVVLRALAREANRRFDTALAMRDALLDSGKHATTEQVAAFFAETLADQAKARKKMLDRAMAAAAQREKARAQLSFVSGPTATLPGTTNPGIAPPGVPPAPGSNPEISSEPRLALSEEVTTTGTIARAALAAMPAEPPRSRRWVIAAAVGGVAALVGVGVLVGATAARGGGPTAGSSAPPPSASVPSAATPATETAAPPASITAASSAKPPATAPTAPSATTAKTAPKGSGARPTPSGPRPKPTDDTIF